MPAPKKPHGKIIYLYLPTTDITKSAEFYREVFGWTINESENGVTFSDSVGQVHGVFTNKLEPADMPGYLLYLMVQDATETGKRIIEFGGDVKDPADRDENDPIGTFRDPSGNLFGFYEMKTDSDA